MADNLSITPGTGAKAATDEVTYSGDTAMVQLVRLVDVTGAEGSKTVAALTLPVADSAGNTAIAATNTALGTANTALAAMKTDLDSLVTAANSTTPSPVEVTNPSYEAVAASASAQVMGASGAAGDILSHVLIIPATTSPGAVSIQDGAGSAITIFAGGASSVTSLIPFAVPLGIIAATNWKITTGANVSAVGVGKFT